MDQDQENAWINTQHQEWQIAWHDILEVDPELKSVGEYNRPNPLPEDVNADFDLIFGFINASEKSRKQCFDLFPSGREMHRRYCKYFTTQFKEISSEQAVERLNEIIKLAERLTSERPLYSDTIDDLIYCDHKQAPLISNKNRSNPLLTSASMLFLSEPLYFAAGHYYQLRNWVVSAMHDEEESQLFEAIYELWNCGWRLDDGDDGIMVQEI